MSKFTQFKKLLNQVQVVRAPRHRLATFGHSVIDYTLVTDMPGLPDRSKIRFGQVKAEKPLIMTIDTLKERFQGFGDQAEQISQWLTQQYGEAMRGLEYQFQNEPSGSRIELTSPDQLMKELAKEFDRSQDFRKALIRGTDKMWQLSIMKFIVEETLTSFGSNFQELKERGFFDVKSREDDRHHREIRYLIRKAKADHAQLPLLSKKLKEYGLFDQYQDEFFQLVK